MCVSEDRPAARAAGENGPYSILLMGFGQSNADVHDAGPRFYPPDEEYPLSSLPVVMPNDGREVRGHMGRERGQRISGFVPVSEASKKAQSLLVAAAARLLHDNDDPSLERVIVRSEARGGRRFLAGRNRVTAVDGIFRDPEGNESNIFSNLLASIRQCIEAAQDEGCPIRLVNIVWLHGESDRAMPRAEYSELFQELIDVVESRLAETGVAFEWTVVQTAGTGARGDGNFWPNRMSVLDVADARDNVSVAVTGYPYEQMDGAHYSGYGKLLLGENIGRMIALRMAGRPHTVPQLATAEVRGQDVDLTIDAADPICLDHGAVASWHGTLMGFHAQDRSRAVLQSVSVISDDTLRLSFDRAPDPDSLMVHYAYTRNSRDNTPPEGNYPFGGGCLRTTASSPSVLLDGEELYDWVAGFTIDLSG